VTDHSDNHAERYSMSADRTGHGGVEETRVLDAIRGSDPEAKEPGVALDPIQVRRIAESMGVGSRVLDALYVEDDVDVARTTRFRRLRRVQRFLLGATGLGFGWVGRFIENLTATGPAPLPTVLVPVVGLALFLIGYNRLRGEHRSYQLDNAILWAGFTIGWSVLMPGTRGDWLAGVVAWIALAALGLLAVGPRKSKPQPFDTDAVDPPHRRLSN
jgi:hypothetical protein